MRPFTSAALRQLSRRAFHSSGARLHVLQALEERGLVADVTSRAVREHLSSPRTIYCGVDPSADSLHLGNLVALVGLLHFQLHGHDILSLIGGATGSVGDPSGRSSERQALSPEQLQHNIQSITRQLQQFFERGIDHASRKSRSSIKPGQLKVVNNADWLGSLSLLDFLAGPGKRARVSSMLSRESIKTRLNSESGISFTEFTYNLLQAYDFLHLHQSYDCTIQLGGSDQYGNIMAGIEMMQREGLLQQESKQAYGITLPLLTTSAGAKFGKSAGNAIWMDPARTSPFELYQFLLQCSDADVLRYLKVFTFMPAGELQEVFEQHQRTPDKRIAQSLLAAEVTELIHGPEAKKHAEAATSLLFSAGEAELSAAEALAALPESLVRQCLRENVHGKPVTKLAVEAGLAASNSKARQLIQAGGLYVNGTQMVSGDQILEESQVSKGVIVLRAGKNQHKVLVVQ